MHQGVKPEVCGHKQGAHQISFAGSATVVSETDIEWPFRLKKETASWLRLLFAQGRMTSWDISITKANSTSL